jgi:nicotinamidase/pyrazinamidase
MTSGGDFTPHRGHALVVVDVQRDFLPGGALAVPDGDKIIPSLNRRIDQFTARGLPVFATRDWHPATHASFDVSEGMWPPHCVQGTPGAEFPKALRLPSDVVLISKGTDDGDGYSAFEGTDLEKRLADLNIYRLFVGGLATDFCVAETVSDALDLDFKVIVLLDAVRAINDAEAEKKLAEFESRGAVLLRDEVRA